MAGPIYRYLGADRNGQTRMGSMLSMDLGKFVQTRYRNGWRSLSISLDGRQLAGIESGDGRRWYWVEEVERLG